MLDKNYIKEKVVSLLPIDSTMYNDQIDILVGGAISKLKNEGIDNVVIDEDSNQSDDYCICCAYQVAVDLDLDLDINRLEKMYLTRVNTLRTSLINV